MRILFRKFGIFEYGNWSKIALFDYRDNVHEESGHDLVEGVLTDSLQNDQERKKEQVEIKNFERIK